MYKVSFMGSNSESSGSIGDKPIDTSKKETSGSVGARTPETLNIQLKSLDRDAVCFKGAKEDSSSAFGTITGIGVTAAAIVVGLGCAKKYNLVDKITNQKVKDIIVKYGTDPCYNACKYVKDYSFKTYDKIVNYFKK